LFSSSWLPILPISDFIGCSQTKNFLTCQKAKNVDEMSVFQIHIGGLTFFGLTPVPVLLNFREIAYIFIGNLFWGSKQPNFPYIHFIEAH
jgi:hypothetical protein